MSIFAKYLPKPPSVVAAMLLIAVVAWAVAGGDSFGASVEAARAWAGPILNWYYVAVVAGFLGAMIWLGASRYHSVRLGKPGTCPEYKMTAWLSMLFAAGTGVGMLFWGAAEPLRHLQENPFSHNAEPDAVTALRLAYFHWALSGWAIFALTGLCLAYFHYARDYPLTLRSALFPMLGRAANGPIGLGFDIVAVVATAFGIATTLALGAGQIAAGLEQVFGVSGSTFLKLGIIGGIIAVSTTSVALGLKRGIRRLSEFNILLVALLLIFFLAFGPTNHLAATTIQAAGAYLQTLPRQSLFTGANGGGDWIGKWTIFFWGWWIAWAPFVGMFIARISRGRTIGEFLFGVFILPTVFTIIWFGTVGGTALDLQTSGAYDVISAMGDVDARALFITIDQIGASETLVLIVGGLTIFLIAIFFATSADSGTLVVTTILSGGQEKPPMFTRVGWSIGIGMLTAAMTFAGDIRIVQSAVVLAAFPFSIMLIAMCAGLIRALTNEEEGPREGSKAHRPKQPWTGEDEPE